MTSNINLESELCPKLNRKRTISKILIFSNPNSIMLKKSQFQVFFLQTYFYLNIASFSLCTQKLCVIRQFTENSLNDKNYFMFLAWFQ